MTILFHIGFHNVDAARQIETVTVAYLKDVAKVVRWYGAFFAGDEYAVTVNGEQIEIDQNGAVVHIKDDCPATAINPIELNELPPGDEPRG